MLAFQSNTARLAGLKPGVKLAIPHVPCVQQLRRPVVQTASNANFDNNVYVGGSSASSGSSSGPVPAQSPDNVLTQLQRTINNTFNKNAPGQRQDWREVEGAWVLPPPGGRAPQAVVHFLGGAFVGAAPQLAYRLLLEALSNRDILVIATPYETVFDQLRIADESQFRFEKALRAQSAEAQLLPVYGVGHSQGAIIQLLISARYAVNRAGNAYICYNNRGAAEVVPFLSPLIAPGARMLGPLLQQVVASPARASVEGALDTLRSLSPSMLRQVAPLVEQLAALYLDVSQGRNEFSPSPEETRNIITTYYNVPRNLLIRFKDDGMDDTNTLAGILQNSPNVSEQLDLSVRTLPGDHLRPLQQALVDLPPDVARLGNQAVFAAGGMFGKLADVATTLGVSQATGPLTELSKGVTNMANMMGGETGGPLTDNMQSLADEIAAFIGTGSAVISGSRALPAKSVFTDRNHLSGGVNGRSPSPAAL